MQEEPTPAPTEKPARRSLFRKAKPFAAPAQAASQDAPPEAASEEAPAAKKRRSPLRLMIVALPVLGLLGGGGAYGWHLWSAEAPHEDAAAATHENPVAPIEEATAEHAAPAAEEGHGAPSEEASAGAHGAAEAAVPPLAVAVAADDSAVAATDYAIVAVYDEEAILATRRSLYRVKVGTTLPGLGEITAVEVVGDGGTVTGSLATLRAASVTAARPVPPAG